MDSFTQGLNESTAICGGISVYDKLFNFINNDLNQTKCASIDDNAIFEVYNTGRNFFAYFTPVILLVGIIGNSLSLNVFISRNMRCLSASTYLATLSTSDLLVLIFYVAVEWLRRGLAYLVPDAKLYFLDINGVCQIQLYLSYVSRFLSAWIIVAFTVERYIGVCHPLHRRYICSSKSTKQIVSSILIVAIVIVIYKPILSGVYKSSVGTPYCTGSKEHDFAAFVLDSIFAILITLVPFIVITVLNILIMRKLFTRNKRQKACRVITEESVIRLEFTIILLAISICFIAFNTPYFVFWCRNFLTSKYVSRYVDNASDANLQYWRGLLYIARTIFYMNYCVNFFLYSITGAYFRREVRMLFTYSNTTETRQQPILGRYSRNSHSNTPLTLL
ncbi:cysteinyl leukotriene receptor 2-like [Mytilus galloprovincialis]|uniref:cysteinyl leukotriene receptor 2-like n=1 Tax=Mytilus galloprovincialis TaxID=29158 RepID=UPI003F7BBB33